MNAPPTCLHGNEVLYLPEWDEWAAKMATEQCSHHMPLFCGCRPPSAFQRRYMTETIQLAKDSRIEKERFYEARLNAQKKPPGKSEGTDGKDESAGRWYFITFTQPDTIKEPHDLLKRTMKVIKSKMVSPVQWCYSLELTEKGIPHTHIRLFTEKYFDYKKVGAFNKGYRFDIQCEKFTTGEYVAKGAISAEYLRFYSLKQWFWFSDNYVGPRPENIFSAPDIKCPVSECDDVSSTPEPSD